MVVGIGVDMVDMGEFRRLCGGFGNLPVRLGVSGEKDVSREPGVPNAFVARTFSEAERAQALERADSAEFLAGRFAVKEAVFKAVSPHAYGSPFELRMVESLDDKSGAPYVVVGEGIKPVLEAAGVTEVLVSITNEGDYVVAFALVQ
jgi:holo-[acyl-carrier protein] synthase